MIVKTKPLKIQLKQTQNPLEDFVLINNNNQTAVSKEILFVRYIGVPNTIEHYIDNIKRIDEHFTSSPNTSYLRLGGLEAISNKNDINRLANIWDNWQTVIDNPSADKNLIYQTPLCLVLDNEILEWTKKITFIKIVAMYKKTNPNSNATLLKNFVVKFLNWIEAYLPKLFKKSPSLSPKVIFIGDIKHHELLFLYFLSRLGCDVCYMNPKEDIVNLCPEIESFSTRYTCSALYSADVTIPEFIPATNIEPIPLAPIPNTITQSVLVNTTKQRQKLVNASELSYEQLAGLSNSVVMIKVYDEENKIMCSGSGVIIHSSGYILTNLHVVGGGHYYSVIYENDTQEYLTDHFIKYHQLYDLAIIKVDKDCSPLTLKTDDNLVRGQKIVAIGSPLGLFNSFSDGIVSGFRDLDSIPMIQFTAPISNGSSGGALLDMFGRLVGLITGGFDRGQNLNLAVPSDKIYEFAQNFIEHTN
ncbi:trypsin-like peptidase domain-containing protein [Lysinibacillus sphaericus]|uniref:Periplasmic serine protease DO-like protein n=1 Tax=Lysinibacillus sphaericus OT4b.31 TaxID=1285586 RepID=R7ZK45_LYSSH|nr:trypsin-like peptidase domain-containing protein [Lysinibacillus sphaericus]EON74441.1 periplasmic serine protease DO-like protein [Lysinibacillus sphaericus OT4b.31]